MRERIRRTTRWSTPMLPDVRSEAGQVPLVRSLVIVAIVGLLLFEGGAIVFTRFQAGDVASQAASEAGIEYVTRRSEEAARVEAEEYVSVNHAEFVAMSIDNSSRRISVTVRKTARTLLVHRIGSLKSLTQIQATESAPLR